MKIVKTSMRLWFTVASILSFLGGWVLLAHANKPAPLQISQPAISAPASNPTFRSFTSNSTSGAFPFSVQGQSSFARPRLRTGGS